MSEELKHEYLIRKKEKTITKERMMNEKIINKHIEAMLGLFHANEAHFTEYPEYTCKGKFPQSETTPIPTVTIDFEKDPLHAEKVEFLNKGEDQNRDERENEWNKGKERWEIDSLLGTYASEESRITLYAKSIATVATDLKVDANQLAEIVLLHELGHWASHRVKDDKVNDWKDFTDASEKNKEQWAQILAYWTMKEMGECGEPLIETFNELMEKQRDVYQLDSVTKHIIDGTSDTLADTLGKVVLLNTLIDNRKGGVNVVGGEGVNSLIKLKSLEASGLNITYSSNQRTSLSRI